MKRWIEPAGGAMSKSFSNNILECRKSMPATLKAVLLQTGLLADVLDYPLPLFTGGVRSCPRSIQ
jgi:hypothetical protein